MPFGPLFQSSWSGATLRGLSLSPFVGMIKDPKQLVLVLLFLLRYTVKTKAVVSACVNKARSRWDRRWCGILEPALAIYEDGFCIESYHHTISRWVGFLNPRLLCSTFFPSQRAEPVGYSPKIFFSTYSHHWWALAMRYSRILPSCQSWCWIFVCGYFPQHQEEEQQILLICCIIIDSHIHLFALYIWL